MGNMIGTRPGQSYVAGAECVYRDELGYYIRQKQGRDIVKVYIKSEELTEDSIVVRFNGSVTVCGAAIVHIAPGYCAIRPVEEVASCAWTGENCLYAHAWGVEPLSVAKEIAEMEVLQCLEATLMNIAKRERIGSLSPRRGD